MPAQEINSTDWTLFCERFLKIHRGTPITIIHMDEGGREREVVRAMPLQNINYRKDACNDHIQISVMQSGKGELNHDIVEPIHVKVREENGGTKSLQVDAENGTTVLKFSSGRFEELLEGIQTV